MMRDANLKTVGKAANRRLCNTSATRGELSAREAAILWIATAKMRHGGARRLYQGCSESGGINIIYEQRYSAMVSHFSGRQPT